MLTVDFFKRTKQWAIESKYKKVAAKYRLESLVAFLAYHKVNTKELVQAMTKSMDIASKGLKFLQAFRDGKVEFMPLFEQLFESLQDYLINQGKQVISQAFYDVFKALTPTKYVQVAYSIGNKGSALAYDWLTDPSVVRLSMKRTTVNTLAISTAIPKLKAVRYLKVPDANPLILDDTLHAMGTMGTVRLLATAEAPESNNLLVYSGFKASVENQSAYLKGDSADINNLLANKNVSFTWHVKKFASSANVVNLPVSARTCSNAFGICKIDEVVTSSIWWWLDPIIYLDGNNPVHKEIFYNKDTQTSTLGNYKAIDFTEVYKNQLDSTSAYPLLHKTPGIYSDYTHTRFKTALDEQLFQNTFNIYVLPDLNAVFNPQTKTKVNLDTTLNNDSRLYCENQATYCGQGGEIQLNFNNTALWELIGKNGLWAVWVDNGGNQLSKPMSVSIYNSDTAFSLPKSVNLKSYLLVYEDVMHGYLQHSGESTGWVLPKALNARLNKTRYPLIALRLGDLQRTTTAKLKPKDGDGDNVPDYLDRFPQDKRYAYDSDNDGMPDEWEQKYGLNIFYNEAADDYDNDGVSNLNEFKAGTSPVVLMNLTGTYGDSKVNLKWTAVSGAAYVLCYAKQPIVDINNCLNYVGGKMLDVINNQYTVTGLLNGTKYYFRVIAENNVATLGISNQLAAMPQKPSRLNDTGITTCSDATQNGLPCPVTGFPGQDAQYGRDKTNNNNADGHAGFSFTKISATGAPLAASATSWNCVRDNVTGLMWEVKNNGDWLHKPGNSYTWYNPDSATNGGFAGVQNGAWCFGSECDTYAYVKAVNTAGWCGYKDWRLPSNEELHSIIDYSSPSGIDDYLYYSNMEGYCHWSSLPSAHMSSHAWGVDFSFRRGDNLDKSTPCYILLVRSEQ